MTADQLPGLTPTRAHHLARDWNDGGLWEDVLWLARQNWAATDVAEGAVRWHHLVLAVGNFKRQNGRRLRPGRLDVLPDEQGSVGETFRTPAGLRIDSDDETTWRLLSQSTRGAGVATTTTLLAAMWPDQHFVFDWRVRAAASALRIASGLDPCPSVTRNIAGSRLPPVSFEDYSSVRDWLGSVGCPLVTSERALYRLSQRVASVRDCTWSDYSFAVAAKLHEISSPHR